MDYSFICEAIYGGTKRSDEWETGVSKFLMSKGCKFPLINGYGMTETAGAFAVANIQNGKMMPYAKNNVMILNQETGEELKYEQEGEVCVSSPTLMTGYYGDCSENNILFEKDGCTWMHTGDMGKVMPDGELIITGRIKRIYGKISKEGAMVRVYPMRIEEEISKIPEVASVAVVGKKNSSVAFLSYAFIIPKNDNFDREKLKTIISDYCFRNLPESHIPDEYVFLDAFPLTRAGKVDYMELEKMIE